MSKRRKPAPVVTLETPLVALMLGMLGEVLESCRLAGAPKGVLARLESVMRGLAHAAEMTS